MARLSERRRELLTSMMQDSIYEAVAAVLAEHGIRGMTMDRVAEQAEVAKGSLYNYFPNKQALLQFVHEKALAPVLAKRARGLVGRFAGVGEARGGSC